MRKLFYLLFLIIHIPVLAQLNTDSLMHEIKDTKKFTRTDTVHYFSWRTLFIRYESKSSPESYDFFIDSTGKFSDFLGVAIVYKKYDEQGRTVKMIGYGMKGNYDLWDFSAITLTRYSGDTTIEDHYNRKNTLTYRVANVVDKKGRTTCTLDYDHTLCLHSKVIRQYNDTLHQVLIKYFDGHDHYKPNKFGVSIVLEEYAESDYLKITGKHLYNSQKKTGEYFYNSKMKLVDADHKEFRFTPELTYSYIIKEIEDGRLLDCYYNSKKRLVCQGDENGDLSTMSNWD